MRKIKLMVDSYPYKSKPTSNDVPQIQKRLKNESSIKELTISELIECIGNGNTIVPAVMLNGVKKENFQEQQLIMVDIDNEKDEELVTPMDLILPLKEKNLSPFGYYHTFNSTIEKPKFRLMFLLEEPVKERQKVEFVLKTLLDNISQCDIKCTNVSRLFFGTNNNNNKIIILDENATIKLDDVIKLDGTSNKLTIEKDKELTRLVSEFDLLSYMKTDNEILATSNDIVHFKNCSICGHSNCLKYYPKTNSFYCFGANGATGGNIINYLMITKGLTKKDAIDYFKYDLLKLPKKKSKQIISLSTDEEQQFIHDLFEDDEIKKNLPPDIDWIEVKPTLTGIYCSVNCPKLARYIANNLDYLVARNRARGGVLKYYYFDNHYKLLSDDEMKGFIKQYIPLELQKIKDFNEIMGLLATEKRFISIDELNDDENIINFKNGILDLRTGKLEPHSPKYYTTIQIPCDYIENCPIPETRYFDNFIKSLTNGDEEVEELLYQFMGVAISNIKGYRMKQALFLYGPGDTGKTEIKSLLTELLGVENCSSIDLKDLEKPFKTIEVFNKRLAGPNDMSTMRIATLDKFKQLTGGDYINDSFKYEGAIDFKYKGVIIACGNKLLDFGGDRGDHVYKRMIIVECTNVIPEELQNKNLLDSMLTEKEYIIQKLVKGAMKVMSNKFRYDIPKVCKKTLERYKISNNSFLDFMEECVIDRNGRIEDDCSKPRFYRVYKAWCDDNKKIHAEKKKEVKETLEKLGKNNIVVRNGDEYYTDFTIKPEVINEYYDAYYERRK